MVIIEGINSNHLFQDVVQEEEDQSFHEKGLSTPPHRDDVEYSSAEESIADSPLFPFATFHDSESIDKEQVVSQKDPLEPSQGVRKSYPIETEIEVIQLSSSTPIKADKLKKLTQTVITSSKGKLRTKKEKAKPRKSTPQKVNSSALSPSPPWPSKDQSDHPPSQDPLEKIYLVLNNLQDRMCKIEDGQFSGFPEKEPKIPIPQKPKPVLTLK